MSLSVETLSTENLSAAKPPNLSDKSSINFSENSSFPSPNRQNLIFTGRSLVILFFITYLLADPIYRQSDIIASVLSISLISLLFILALICLYIGNKLRKSTHLAIFPPTISNKSENPSEYLVSQKYYTIVTRTSPLKIPPFWKIRINLKFISDDLIVRDFQVTGFSEKDRILTQEVSFPHRGNWALISCALEFSDSLGLTQYCWTIEEQNLNTSIQIAPSPEESTSFPVLSSSDKSGDTLPDIKERKGDYYDIKSYHPSDGMRRILWKVYAKSGELFSRHPEASMTPEGQVVAFALANKNEDRVCSVAHTYLQKLESLNIEVFFSCDGAEYAQVALNSEDALSLLIDSVWNSSSTDESSIIKDLNTLIASVQTQRQSINLKRILVFCSRQRLLTNSGSKILLALGNHLEEIGIKPIFCLVDTFLFTRTNSQNSALKSQHSPFWMRYIWQNNALQSQETFSHDILDDFLKVCLHNEWLVTTET